MVGLVVLQGLVHGVPLGIGFHKPTMVVKTGGCCFVASIVPELFWALLFDLGFGWFFFCRRTVDGSIVCYFITLSLLACLCLLLLWKDGGALWFGFRVLKIRHGVFQGVKDGILRSTLIAGRHKGLGIVPLQKDARPEALFTADHSYVLLLLLLYWILTLIRR